MMTSTMRQRWFAAGRWRRPSVINWWLTSSLHTHTLTTALTYSAPQYCAVLCPICISGYWLLPEAFVNLKMKFQTENICKNGSKMVMPHNNIQKHLKLQMLNADFLIWNLSSCGFGGYFVACHHLITATTIVSAWFMHGKTISKVDRL